MNAWKPALAALALLFLVTQARAESRSVLVQVKHVKGKASVTIYSDDKKDRRTGASLDDALKAVKAMTGWGSTVGVYVASDKDVREEDLGKLHAAVKANWWLGLLQKSGEVPRHLRDHFLQDGKR